MLLSHIVPTDACVTVTGMPSVLVWVPVVLWVLNYIVAIVVSKVTVLDRS